jgi:hypothetical protein
MFISGVIKADNTFPVMASVLDTATETALATAIITETTTDGTPFDMATIAAVATHLGTIVSMEKTNKLGAAVATFFCPKSGDIAIPKVANPACAPTSASDIAAIQYIYGTVYSSLGLVQNPATGAVMPSGVPASSRAVLTALMGTPIPFDTELFELAAASKAWPSNDAATITTAGKVLKAMRGSSSLATGNTVLAGFKNFAETYATAWTAAAAGIDTSIAASIAAAKANIIAANASTPDAVAATQAAAAVNADAATIAALGGKGALLASAAGVPALIAGIQAQAAPIFDAATLAALSGIGTLMTVAANGTVVNFMAGNTASNSVVNAHLFEKMYRLCVGVDTAMKAFDGLAAIDAALKPTSACPTLTGSMGVSLTTAQIQDVAVHLVNGVTKEIFKSQYSGFKLSGPIITRPVKDMLMKKGGFVEPFFAGMAALLGVGTETKTVINAATAAPTTAEVDAKSKKNKAGCVGAAAAITLAPTTCKARPAAYGTTQQHMGNTKATMKDRGVYKQIDGSTAIAGECVAGCWKAENAVFKSTKSGAQENQVIGKVNGKDAIWNSGTQPPMLALIHEAYPLKEGSALKFDTEAHIYVSNAKRPFKFEYTEDVDSPDKKLKMRRFMTTINSNTSFYTDADRALEAGGVKCAFDITEISSDDKSVPALLSKPHLLDCAAADLKASTTITTPVWSETTGAKLLKADLDFNIDFEPHTGAAMCANQRIGAYMLYDPTLGKLFHGGMCGKGAALANYPASLAGCAGTVKKIVFPWYWVNVRPCLDSATETSVAGQFATVKMMSGTVSMALLAAGAVVALIGLILIALSCKGGGKVSAV